MSEADSFYDFLGVETKVGDTVVTTEMHYRNFIKAKVVKITAKMVFLEELTVRKHYSSKREWKAEKNFVIRIA